VFLETHTVLCHISLDYFVEFRSRLGGRESSQLNLPLVYEWIDLLPTEKPFVVFGKQDLKKEERNLLLLSLLENMLSLEPKSRPLASNILNELPDNCCCRSPLEDFQSEPMAEELVQDIGLINFNSRNGASLFKPQNMNLLSRTVVLNGHTAMTQELLAVHTMADDNVSGLLQIAVIENDKRAVVDLMRFGANPGYCIPGYFDGKSAIHIAGERHQEALLRVMLYGYPTPVDVVVNSPFGRIALNCCREQLSGRCQTSNYV
jgi:hypothetical protein